MSAGTWFVGFLIIMWTLGYSVGHIFLSITRFIEKSK